MSRIIKCEHCNVEFEAQRSDTRFCSKKCVHKNWYKNNKKRNQELGKKWIQNNKEKFAAIQKKYKEKNQEKVKTTQKKWAKENCEKVREIHKKWARENPEAYKFKIEKWRAKNPEKFKAIVQKCGRRASYRKLGYPEELLEIKELQYQIKKEIKNQLKGEGK